MLCRGSRCVECLCALPWGIRLSHILHGDMNVARGTFQGFSGEYLMCQEKEQSKFCSLEVREELLETMSSTCSGSHKRQHGIGCLWGGHWEQSFGHHFTAEWGLAVLQPLRAFLTLPGCTAPIVLASSILSCTRCCVVPCKPLSPGCCLLVEIKPLGCRDPSLPLSYFSYVSHNAAHTLGLH